MKNPFRYKDEAKFGKDLAEKIVKEAVKETSQPGSGIAGYALGAEQGDKLTYAQKREANKAHSYYFTGTRQELDDELARLAHSGIVPEPVDVTSVEDEAGNVLVTWE